jgi:D-alanyl-D-alanine endopeptidase (penicillin-binding protein 7)
VNVGFSKANSDLVRKISLMALIVAFCLPMAAKAAEAAPANPKKKVAAVKARTSAKAPAKRVVVRAKTQKVRYVPEKPSFGKIAGLHGSNDPLDLKSSVALVMDQDTNEILYTKNSDAVLPIASLTKLMTAVVVTEANLPPDEVLSITQADVDTEKGSTSRLTVGTKLTRGQMMHLALMASENRAALDAFVVAMNKKAADLGMADTKYIEPTGLSSRNQSSARDLAVLVKTANTYPVIRELSTSPEYEVAVGRRHVQFRNTNGLVRNPQWDISLQKTGYISEAGRCLVMNAKLAGRQLIMVFLDSAGKYSRIGDAERVRRWVNELPPSVPAVAPTAQLSDKLSS